MENGNQKDTGPNMFYEDSQLFVNIQRHIVLDSSDKKYLEAIFSVEDLLRRELVLKQGRSCKKLFFVESGSLRAYNLGQDGKEATVMFAVRDWWITDMHCFLSQKPALLSLEALEDSRVITLDFTAFETLLDKIPKFERFFRILFQNAYVREQLRVLDNISLSTEERFRKFVVKYPQIAEKVSQKQIASYLGVTPEFLSSIKRKEGTS